MTEAELLTALAEARLGGEGSTVEELCAETGWSDRRVRTALKVAIAKGEVRVSRKQKPDMSGRIQTVPSYVTC